MIWWEIQGFSRASNIRKDVKKTKGFLWTTDLPMIGLLYLFLLHILEALSKLSNMGFCNKHGISMCMYGMCIYIRHFFKQNRCSNILLALQSDKLTIHKCCLKLTWIYWDHMAELQRSHRDVTGMFIRIGVTIPIAFFGWLVSVQPDITND